MVDLLANFGPIRDPYFLEFSEEVRSKFRVIGGVDSTLHLVVVLVADTRPRNNMVPGVHETSSKQFRGRF